ncbi:AraC family transcriptional regulator [Salinisphaera sp. SPP-AMP-43]|uniref:AraC family transcriptional regulator n=1 Tax=Salinisphaera sp. SPP-AMP-43 TaxID=3121288 RepID=UPI003C6E7803
MAHGAITPGHHHDVGHLVYAGSGCYQIETVDGLWLTPPQQAVWIPPATPHHARASGRVDLYTVYIDIRAARTLPTYCAVMPVGCLLRALIEETSRWTDRPPAPARRRHVTALLIDELQPTSAHAFQLAMPPDPRLQRLCRSLLEQPARGWSLVEWGQHTGASARTLARCFKRETGLTFAQWRREARLFKALEWLAEGASIAEVAYRVGYDSPSAFSHMFQRALGCPPSQYFEARP